MGLNSEEYDARIRQDWASCIQLLIHIVKRRAQTKRKRNRIDSPQRNPQFSRTVDGDNRVSQSALYLKSSSDLKYGEGGNVSPNTNPNLSQELVTNLARHENSYLFDQASTNGQHSRHKDTSVEFKSRGQGSREAGFTKSVDV